MKILYSKALGRVHIVDAQGNSYPFNAETALRVINRGDDIDVYSSYESPQSLYLVRFNESPDVVQVTLEELKAIVAESK